jgi:hypothetical protein
MFLNDPGQSTQCSIRFPRIGKGSGNIGIEYYDRAPVGVTVCELIAHAATEVILGENFARINLLRSRAFTGCFLHSSFAPGLCPAAH